MYKLPANRLAVRPSGYATSLASDWIDSGFDRPRRRTAAGTAARHVEYVCESADERMNGSEAAEAREAVETATSRARITLGWFRSRGGELAGVAVIGSASSDVDSGCGRGEFDDEAIRVDGRQ